MHGVLMTRALVMTLSSVLIACSPIFDESDCSDKLIRAATSANGQFVAQLIRRDCGATTDFANIVYLKKSGDAKGKDGAWGEKIYVLQGEMQIALEWRGIELNIKAPTLGKNVFLKRDEWAGIKIIYE
jgi:hypothetical protein